MADERTVELPPSLRAAVLARRGFPRSHELASGVLILMLAGVFTFLAPEDWYRWDQFVSTALATCGKPAAGAMPGADVIGWQVAALLAIVWMAAVLAMGVQGGMCWRPQAIAPSWGRLCGLQSWRTESLSSSLWSACVAMARMIFIVAVGLAWLWYDYPTAILRNVSPSTRPLGPIVTLGIVRGVTWIGVAWLLLGVIDYGVRWVTFRRSLRVSEKEWREALRALSGNPEVRQRLRELRHRS